MSEHTRIKFYSVHDLSFASNMKRVESFFEKWEQNTCSPDINTILELYNIKQYFYIKYFTKSYIKIPPYS